MCGRFSLAKPELLKAKDLGIPRSEIDRLRPRYNIAPSQSVAVVAGDEGVRRTLSCRWGLIPRWAKDEKIGQRLINARAETLREKPSFRGLLHRNRCLILADGFFEWLKTRRGKQPYYIRLRSGEPFCFAGLWDRWKSPAGQQILTCTIITCHPNRLLEKIHDCMPVMMDGLAIQDWMDAENKDESALAGLLGPYPADRMEAYPVTRLVNSPGKDSVDVLLRISTAE